jgi:hypothetical protein
LQTSDTSAAAAEPVTVADTDGCNDSSSGGGNAATAVSAAADNGVAVKAEPRELGEALAAYIAAQDTATQHKATGASAAQERAMLRPKPQPSGFGGGAPQPGGFGGVPQQGGSGDTPQRVSPELAELAAGIGGSRQPRAAGPGLLAEPVNCTFQICCSEIVLTRALE